MPTSEPMTMGEVARLIVQMDHRIEVMSNKMVDTQTLDLTMRAIQQSLKAMDDRHTTLATEVATEREDRRGTKRLVWAAVVAAVAAVIVPLMLRGVGLS